MPDPLPRVPISYDGRKWHFHHEQELPKTVELIAAMMAEAKLAARLEDFDPDSDFPWSLAEEVWVLAGTDAVDVPTASGQLEACPQWEGRMAS
ncbi:hypothetical protein [Haloferula sp. BvORR071]|uniref:hypothetical protein n=1 Tax=Haloferula sp. BvORR071 TaxID=1396141 RepID=UPI000557C12A|nr:hypothetical protein [Haloferula sp. BvORR071]